MYAFIDVINILGGIEIELEEDLIDPTYRVKEDGRWSTMYYPKGIHRLKGLEALRIARSRHTSSDLDRAERQQKILTAVKKRIEELGLANIGKLYKLIQTLLKYVDTNFTPFELVQFYNEFNNTRVDISNVLSTENVLYQTYSNLYLLNEEQQAIMDDSFDKGAWILLPKNQDWNLIRWYIREIIN